MTADYPNFKTIALDSEYLEDIKSNIRNRPIAWDGFARTKELTEDEAAKIKTLSQAATIQQKAAAIDQAPAVYATTLLSVLDKIKRDDVLKSLLVLTNDLLLGVPIFSEELLKLSLDADTLPYEPFTKFLGSADESIKVLGVYNLVILLAQRAYTKHAYVAQTVDVLSKTIAASTNLDSVATAVQLLRHLFTLPEYREVYWKSHATLFPPLLTFLQSGKGDLQVRYHTLLAVWLLTFSERISVEMPLHYQGVLKVLTGIAKNSIKEKITRLAIAILHNFVAPKSAAYAEAKTKVVKVLLLNNVLPLMKTFSERRWSDEELVADLAALTETLNNALVSLTSMDEYLLELDSGKMTNSPPHSSEEFWHENVFRFKENNFQLFKRLLALLRTDLSSIYNPQIILNDVTCVVSKIPEASKVVAQTGAKAVIMELMTIGSPEVRYEALKATQALVANTFN
ncbi:hypothetical protein BABINDRAFT_7324 [Babjeviella inositovora NRRL Y-12698]|uniref:V-type proton ATPase subunit H n=1 Tax=Babjeviella inositovora NRRL Y-12698 TaxID=984486 RepID=A0A1E3QSD2_9ASCO|nr:uncharacterized protein BABINDRAFT_7324 [Babjeviella inositovora NRRL Y-12698]ODQ80613.1 hypothetical protein BABINDRAFT_7324 [Babjeviella inositovora NRRL Y-12698]